MFINKKFIIYMHATDKQAINFDKNSNNNSNSYEKKREEKRHNLLKQK